MSHDVKTKFDEFISDPNQRRAFEREALSLEATELISVLMEQQGVNRSELADRLESSKAHITQVLSGARNMTLHTLAEFLFALGHRARIDAFPLEQPSLSKGRAIRSKVVIGPFGRDPAPLGTLAIRTRESPRRKSRRKLSRKS